MLVLCPLMKLIHMHHQAICWSPDLFTAQRCLVVNMSSSMYRPFFHPIWPSMHSYYSNGEANDSPYDNACCSMLTAKPINFSCLKYLTVLIIMSIRPVMLCMICGWIGWCSYAVSTNTVLCFSITGEYNCSIA